MNSNFNAVDLNLIQVHDSSFPIGTYSHSYGMESYTQDGRITKADEFLEFASNYLIENLAINDVIFIRQAFQATKDQDIKRLKELDEINGALRLAKESREASISTGRQFLRTLSNLYPDNEFIQEWDDLVRKRVVGGHYDITYGIYAALFDIDINAAVQMYLYSTINTLIVNAVRSVPFGQNTGVRLMHEMIPLIMEETMKSEHLTTDDATNNALGIEMGSIHHEYLNHRLYIS